MRRAAAQEVADTCKAMSDSTSPIGLRETDKGFLAKSSSLLTQDPSPAEITASLPAALHYLTDQSRRFNETMDLIDNAVAPPEDSMYRYSQNDLAIGALAGLDLVGKVLFRGNRVFDDSPDWEFWRAHVDMRNDMADSVAYRVKALATHFDNQPKFRDFLNNVDNELRTDPLDMDNKDFGFWNEETKKQNDRFEHIVEMVRDFRAANPEYANRRPIP